MVGEHFVKSYKNGNFSEDLKPLYVLVRGLTEPSHIHLLEDLWERFGLRWFPASKIASYQLRARLLEQEKEERKEYVRLLGLEADSDEDFDADEYLYTD